MRVERRSTTVLMRARVNGPVALLETGGYLFRFIPITAPYRVSMDCYRVRPSARSSAMAIDDWHLMVAEQQCRDLLKLMLVSGQHRWEFPDALEIGRRIGLDPRTVKRGFAI